MLPALWTKGVFESEQEQEKMGTIWVGNEGQHGTRCVCQIGGRLWDWRKHPLSGGKEKRVAGCDLYAKTWKQDLKVGNPTGTRDTASIATWGGWSLYRGQWDQPGRHSCPFHLSSDSFRAEAHQVAGPWQGRIVVFELGHSRSSTYRSHLHHFYSYQE